MNRIITIARREIGAYFNSSIAYVFLAAFVGASLFTFFNIDTFFSRNQADLHGLFSYVPLLMLVLAPALTMRLWAEEQKQGTLEMLLTMPTRTWELVIGKFLASWGLLGIGLLLTVGLPITVATLGDIDWGPAIGGYLGALLLGATYLSIGQFVSATTENQLLALILALGVCLGLWGIGTETFASIFGSDKWAEIFAALGSGSRFDSVARGVIDLRDLLYYVSITVFFLSLAVAALNAKRAQGASLRNRRTSPRESLILTALLLGLNLVAFNYLVADYPTARLDLTEDKLYTVSPVTERLLTTLDDDLTIRCYFSKKTDPKVAPLIPQIKNLLAEYEQIANDHLKVHIYDPSEDEEAERQARDDFGIITSPFASKGKYSTDIVSAYFAIVVSYGSQYEVYYWHDVAEQIPQPDGDVIYRLHDLNFDLTRAMKKVMSDFHTTGNMFDLVEQPIRYTLYVTPDAIPDVFREELDNARTALEQLAQRGGSQFLVEEIDPLAIEDNARQNALLMELRNSFGIFPGPVVRKKDSESNEPPPPYYFSGVLHLGKNRAVSHLFLPNLASTAAELRTGIEEAVKRGIPGLIRTVGVSSPEKPDQQGRGAPMLGAIWSKVRQNYKFKLVDLSTSDLPEELSLLIVVKPTELSQRAVYRIDQFLMGGGCVIVLLDQFQYELKPPGLFEVRAMSTGMDDWLRHYGITVQKTLVLDQQNRNIIVPHVKDGSRSELEFPQVAYPYAPNIKNDGITNDALATGLGSISLCWASPIKVDRAKNSDRQVFELIKSSKDSWTSDDTSLIRISNLEPGVDDKVGPRTLGVSLVGKFESYFKGKPIPEDPTDADKNSGPPPPSGRPGFGRGGGGEDERTNPTGDATGAAEPAPNGAPDPHDDEPEIDAAAVAESSTLTHSPETRLIVIGNTNFINWEVMRYFGISTAQGVFNQNLQFVGNLVNWTLVDEDLISMRKRNAASRELDIEDDSTTWIEIYNYIIPLVLLLGFAGIRTWQRRRTVPLVKPRDGESDTGSSAPETQPVATAQTTGNGADQDNAPSEKSVGGKPKQKPGGES